ncbi:MAG: NUDIX hydrolase [Saprospiraceae bacterium]|nr:NUDIX hydrolase [Saprospiraceae bacterium]MBK8669890.1 NUDIX hydrolase [Saprospiraceae bacterium]
MPSDGVQNINTWITQINTDFKAAVSVDCVIFGYDDEALKILVSKCDMPPFEHEFSLLGDIVHPDETTDDAAKRVLISKTGFTDVYLNQVQVFSEVKRHPLGRVITVAYYSLIKIDQEHLVHLEKNDHLEWKNVNELSSLAFDHLNIMQTCLKKMQIQIREQPIGFHLLPQKFSLLQLQKLYEVILNLELDKRNFRRKLKSLGILKDIGEIQESVSHRPARLYEFDNSAYDKKKKSGFDFGI